MATELIALLAFAAVVAAAHYAPQNQPGDLDPNPASASAMPAASGSATAPAEPPASIPPAPAGCFVLVRDPADDKPGRLPWRHWLRTGARIELAGRWYRVVGPAVEGECTPGDWVYLDGDRPSGVEAAPYRVAIGGGK